MPKYRIFETKEYIENFDLIPNKLKNQFNNKLNNYIYPQLETEPHFGKNNKKLIGYSPETWRYRLGNYRLLYIIQADIVYLLSLELRRDVYK